MRLSIVIPCYNEEKIIKATLKKVIRYVSAEKIQTEIVLINDGSTDKTKKFLDQSRSNFKKNKSITIEIISYRKNRGKGYAVKRGLLQASGKNILICDADLSTPITELAKLLKYIDNYHLVVGSRKQIDAKVPKPQPPIRTLMGKTYSFLSRFILQIKVNDFTCGFKLIQKEPAKIIAQKMRIDRWAYDSELIKIAVIHHYKIKEIGIIWKNRSETRVRLSKDILGSFIDLLKVVIFSLLKRYD